MAAALSDGTPATMMTAAPDNVGLADDPKDGVCDGVAPPASSDDVATEGEALSDEPKEGV
jgi:hypothetical protein